MGTFSHRSICARQRVGVIISKATDDLAEANRLALLMAVVRDDQHLDSSGKLWSFEDVVFPQSRSSSFWINLKPTLEWRWNFWHWIRGSYPSYNIWAKLRLYQLGVQNRRMLLDFCLKIWSPVDSDSENWGRESVILDLMEAPVSTDNNRQTSLS